MADSTASPLGDVNLGDIGAALAAAGGQGDANPSGSGGTPRVGQLIEEMLLPSSLSTLSWIFH